MKVIIIGGVAGGAGTAARLRRNDEFAEITLLERGEFISFANCGLPYYIGGVIKDKEALQLQTPEGFGRRFNVDVKTFSEAVSVDTKKKNVTVLNVLTGEEYTLPYDKLLLSPGAKPIMPPIKGTQTSNVFTLRNIPDTYRISEYIEKHSPKSCAVIGAGFIGLEMAENLLHRGISVSVVEALDHVIAPIDKDMAGAVHKKLRREGISLYLSSRCVEVTRDSVILENGTSIPADIVIMSVGVSPETAFLKSSDIELGSRGEIIVDEYLKTSIDDVYAVGDAVAIRNIVTDKMGVVPLASPANRQARIAADNICGKAVKYNGSQGTAIMKLFNMTIAMTGESERTLKANNIPYKKTITNSLSHAGYYPNAESMTIKLIYDDNGKILGAQIVGYSGVDKRVDSIATILRLGGTIYDLQEVEFCYAPPFSSTKDPANMAAYVAENVLKGEMKPFFIEDLGSIKADDVFIDVRTSEEYAMGHIDGTINIPLDSLREEMNKLPKDRTIYITCQVGQRAYLAQRILEQNGFNTLNLSGGYQFYKQSLDNPQK